MYSARVMLTATEAISQGRRARGDGKLAVARALYAEAAKIYRDQNDLLAYAHTIRHIADMYQDEFKLVEAKPLYEESLQLYRRNVATKILDLANAIRPYALLNEEQGNRDLARELWREARQLYASLRLEPGISECDAHLSKLRQT